jgi:hypothetical protein
VIRTLLVVACVVFVVLALLGMRLGWRNRERRQSSLPALPAVPADLANPLLHSSGVYVGTTFATSWQDRVVAAGLGRRAAAEAVLYPSGLLLDRAADDPVFLPADDWVEARLAPGVAGKVTGAGGLLVVRWRLGENELDTGFRADDKTSYPAWVRAINERVRT